MATIELAYVGERFADGQSSSIDIPYVVNDAATRAEAAAALYDQSPGTVDFYGDGSRVLVKTGVSADQVNEDTWTGFVTYSTQASQPIAGYLGPSEYNGDANGGTKKLLRSIETIARFPNDQSQPGPPEPPDQHGAIGVTKDSVEGIDVPAAGFNWTEKHYLDPDFATWEWIQNVSAMRGMTNDAEFRGFEIEEVLLLDFTWARRQAGDVECTFSFSARKHETDIAVDWIEHIEKKGQHYAWTLTKENVETATVDGADVEIGLSKSYPVGVYVEKVAETADFSYFGIGTEEPF